MIQTDGFEGLDNLDLASVTGRLVGVGSSFTILSAKHFKLPLRLNLMKAGAQPGIKYPVYFPFILDFT